MPQLLLAFALIVIATLAHAQAGVHVEMRASSSRVGMGDSFHVELTALVSAGQPMPQSPRLKLPPGFVAHGPSVSTQQQVTIVGGRMEQRQGMTATWTVTAQRLGNIDLGPASIEVGGRRIEAQRVRIEVVPAGQSPRQQSGSRFPFDPFDPFSGRGLFPSLPSLPGVDDPLSGDPDLAANLPTYPEELRVDTAPDKVAFLRAVATPARAVVGEQVTLRVYAYGGRGAFREVNSTEPSRGDFLAYPIVENSYGETRYRVPIEGAVWNVVKIREIALFPLRSGSLTIGAMRMGFDGRGYPSAAGSLGLVRESAPVEVAVSEPPLSGRPPGYRMGDVGRYQLSAEVRPRQVRAGESIAVELRIEGVGNVPFQISTPQQRGVEWLEPNVYDKVEPQGSTVGGFRKLSYVVRLERAGNFDLGEVTLAYWDPGARAYGVARAPLGKVEVTPGDKPASESATESPSTDRLAGLLTPRKTLGQPAKGRLHLSDNALFWWLLALGPLGVVAAGAGARANRVLRARLGARQSSTETQVSRALHEAREADSARAASAAERAVVLAIEGAVGLKARALVRDELARELEARGLPADLARDIRDLLNELDLMRFTGNGESARPAELVERTGEIVRRLGRTKARSVSEARV